METFIPYIIIAVLLAALLVHILERHSMVVLTSLIIGVLLYIYFPVQKQTGASSTHQHQRPPPVKVQRKNVMQGSDIDSTIIVRAVERKVREILQENEQLSAKVNERIQGERYINTSPRKHFQRVDKDKLDEDCEVNPELFGQYILAECFFKQEKYAIHRVEKLHENGFPNAFYIYLPCYDSEIEDNRELYMTSMELSFETIDLAKQYIPVAGEIAARHQVKLRNGQKVLEIDEKEKTSL